MSDRLSIAAALSVLMMSIYVLFGADTPRTPFAGDDLAPAISIPNPQVSIDASDLLR